MRVIWDQQRFEALLTKDLLERRKRQLRRATNELAYLGVEALQAEMKRVFDRPTNWVLNGAYVIPVRDRDESNRVAVVDWKPGGGSKTVPASKILRAQIDGGQRRQKRFERRLGLPPGIIAVPTRNVRLDRYGNIPSGLITEILSDLRMFIEDGYQANRAYGASKYIMIRRPQAYGQIKPGIYERRSWGVGPPIILFVQDVTYDPRLNPREVVQRVVRTQRDAVWRQALAGTLPERTRAGRRVGGVEA